ncbi:hydroxyacylglutathione hydrolase [Methylophaga frappieri]|uniref:hydroxyacylglutathione hydrolase n=1 Tax=Methylophaga frappieri (strain ATCC BAA-2434 / DSM 25690 / JAM7) TaxID=754477 RepID=UPI001EE68DED|nr:hydroxyacylglutathione hydrolase [Methylophaga frappieri]
MPVHTVPAFTDNYIWLIESAQCRQALIVDPGEAEPVLTALQDAQLTPNAILITHHHADHTGGIEALNHHYDIPVYGPHSEQIKGVTHPIFAGCLIQRDGFPPIYVLDTGGHTPGHISYLIDQKLFCGDTLFAGGCGRLLGGTAPQLFASLMALKSLPDSTRVYCAHEYTEANLAFAQTVEPENTALQQRLIYTRRQRAAGQPTVPSSLAEEKATNPFLRCDEPAVMAAVSEKTGAQLTSPEAVFTALRQWKDNFRSS